MHLTKAAWLFRPRNSGGLGCRRSALVNKTLLAKQTWRFLTRPHALPSRWISSKYVLSGTDLTFRRTSQDSPVWKGICSASSLIRSHFRWKIGDGRCVDITSPAWSIPWNGAAGWFKVSNIIDQDSGGWDWSRINDIYSLDEIDRLRFARPPALGEPDTPVSSVVASGTYSSADGFRLLQKDMLSDQGNHVLVSYFPWKDFWKIKAQPRFLLFI